MFIKYIETTRQVNICEFCNKKLKQTIKLACDDKFKFLCMSCANSFLRTKKPVTNTGDLKIAITRFNTLHEIREHVDKAYQEEGIKLVYGIFKMGVYSERTIEMIDEPNEFLLEQIYP